MVFSDPLFLFLFLPLVLGGYYILPKKLKNLFLFLVSLVFYAFGEPKLVLLMLFSILWNYGTGLLVAKFVKDHKKVAKLWLVVSVIVNVGLLGFFKYSGMIGDTIRLIPAFSCLKAMEIPLPIGISFYTFQAMSYVIDVYRGLCKEQKNLINFGTYITLFPQLIAGPIVRFCDITEQLETRKESISAFSEGVSLFITGLGKKVLIANQAGILWETLSANQEGGILSAWVAMIAYTLQIYFDFSGYSDMACGLGRMFGFQFLENFNYPYISKSVTEFWRRWHISLGTWFREYVYIPLGGNRCNKFRACMNVLIVWMLTGLWHGAAYNFILWGLYYGILLILEKQLLGKFLKQLPSVLQSLITMLIVMFGWMLFAIEGKENLFAFFRRLFSGAYGFCDELTKVYTLSYLPLLVVAFVCATPLPKMVASSVKNKNIKAIGSAIFTLLVLVLATASLVDGSYNPFLYFRF